MNNNFLPTAKWIWCASKDLAPVNQYVGFRTTFSLQDLPHSGLLHIAADDDYVAFLNGHCIGFGQFDDYPNKKTFDSLAFSDSLRVGENTLEILAYWQGTDSFQNLKGIPRLCFGAQIGALALVSDESVQSRICHAFLQGEIELTSPQLSFTYHYDAQHAQDGVWADSIVAPAPQVLLPRPIEKLSILPPCSATITAQGVFQNAAFLTPPTPAQRSQNALLSPRTVHDFWKTLPQKSGYSLAETGIVLPQQAGMRLSQPLLDQSACDGIYILIDLAREEVGYFTIELTASAGTVLDLCYGEHLDDGRVRSYVGNRNFGFRYTCKEGHQTFTYRLRRLAARYLQLQIHRPDSQFALYYAGVLPGEYPVTPLGTFHSADSLLDKIWDVAARTLLLCMHEHYEDCPWREQALYAMDSRNQALIGYYAFGEYRFPAASFALLADSLREDGYLEICAPCKFERTIPSFTYAWVIETAELYLFSGDRHAVAALMPTVCAVLNQSIARMQDGLLPNPQGTGYWNYYEWAYGLDGNGDLGGRFDAPLNLFFAMALKAGAFLCEHFDDSTAAAKYTTVYTKLLESIHTSFWQPEQQAYATSLDEIHFAELTQSLALCSGAVPTSLQQPLRNRLADPENGWVTTTLSHYIYKVDALMQEEHYAQSILTDIRRDWGNMLYSGATAFWETLHGADDFDKAGSLCHGWSAVPLYFMGRYLLGVYPLAPGFSELIQKPLPILPGLSGTVPTPNGIIEIRLP